MAQAYDIAEIFLNPLEKTPHRCGAGSFHDFPRRSDLLARSREIRRLRVIAGAVLDDQLTRLCSGLRRTKGHANRALRFDV